MGLPKTLKAMVIDDSIEHVETLTATLNKYGVHAKGFTNVIIDKNNTIYDEVFQFTPDLIIIKDDFKKFPAWKFAYEVFKEYDDKNQVRPYISVMSNGVTKKHKALCEEMGADIYVQKPFELSDLLKWVNEARNRSEGSEPETEKI